MSDAIQPAVLLTLSVEPERGLRSDVVVGENLRVRVTTVDRATGLPVAATGVAIVVFEPGQPVPVTHSDAQLFADGTGKWLLDVAPESAGGWRFRGKCTGPRAAAKEVVLWVRASSLEDDPEPSPLLVTAAGEVITTPDSNALTAQRMDALPAPPVLSGMVLVGSRGGQAHGVTYEELVGETATPQAAKSAMAGYFLVPILGQSNAVGRGVLDPLFDVPDGRVWQFDDTPASPTYRQIVSGADPARAREGINTGKVGPGAAFGRRLALSLASHHRVLLVSAGSGGTAINRWGPPAGDLYLDAVDATTRALAAAVAELPGSRIGCIVWVQGEANSQFGTEMSEASYAAALDAALNGFRAAVPGASEAPVVIGSMLPEWVAATHRFVHRAHRDTPRRLEGSAFVYGPAGAALDDVHYNGAGIREVGRRAAIAVVRAAGNVDTGELPAAPAIVSVTVQGRTAALVEVEPPPSRVTDYAWQFSTNGGTSWTSFVRSEVSVDYRCLVTGLPPGAAAVRFRVAARNGEGQGEWSAASAPVALAPAAALPGQPYGIRPSNVADTTATVDWYPPEEGDTPTSFIVEWRFGQIAGFPPGPWHPTEVAP